MINTAERSFPEAHSARKREPREIADAIWLPPGSIYRFRALLGTIDFESAKRMITAELQAPSCPAVLLEPVKTPSCPNPLDFDEQLRRVDAGARLVEVRPLSHQMADNTCGGVCSYGA
jgi:hypothetical protein